MHQHPMSILSLGRLLLGRRLGACERQRAQVAVDPGGHRVPGAREGGEDRVEHEPKAQALEAVAVVFGRGGPVGGRVWREEHRVAGPRESQLVGEGRGAHKAGEPGEAHGGARAQGFSVGFASVF